MLFSQFPLPCRIQSENKVNVYSQLINMDQPPNLSRRRLVFEISGPIDKLENGRRYRVASPDSIPDESDARSGPIAVSLSEGSEEHREGDIMVEEEGLGLLVCVGSALAAVSEDLREKEQRQYP